LSIGNAQYLPTCEQLSHNITEHKEQSHYPGGSKVFLGPSSVTVRFLFCWDVVWFKPWWWDQHSALKQQAPITQGDGATFQKNGDLKVQR